MGLVSLLFSFRGRINRLQYWGGTLGAGFLVGFLIVALGFGMILPAAGNKNATAGAALGFLLLLIPLFGLLAWTGLALQWKRFHDRGRPGWFALIPQVITFPAVFTIVSMAASGAPADQAALALQPYGLILSLINIWFLVDLGLLGGVDGPNRYGDPPNGGFSGGSPAPSSAPTMRAPASASATSSLVGAQSAMERAIAEKARTPSPQRAASAPAMQPAPAVAAAPRPASFGRRVTR